MAGQHNADILNRQQHHLVFAGSHKTSMCARKLRNAISTTEDVATQSYLHVIFRVTELNVIFIRPASEIHAACAQTR